MFGLSHWEIMLIALVVIVLFGAKRLPELGKGLGEGMRGFRDALKSKDEPESKELDTKKEGETNGA